MTPTEERIFIAAVQLFVDKGTTQITISELAQQANVARGTLYRNIGSIEGLFDRVVHDISTDMHQRVAATFTGMDDPAARMATGVRLWIRTGHDNPLMGRFAVEFGLLTKEILRTWLAGPPQEDFQAGVASGRYILGSASIESVISMVLGSTLSAMWMVLEGHQTWREAGASTAELLLRALGIDPEEAHEISTRELPALAPSTVL
ncbi:TetR/AcrR family transcriptional regulator [Nocardia sp. bgisy134]|uniref:TetR/AcrR family transcriptional regulator n=1 Tax=unclassified Nocardia TaxID=2637762 RepID=UPI003D73C6AC